MSHLSGVCVCSAAPEAAAESCSHISFITATPPESTQFIGKQNCTDGITSRGRSSLLRRVRPAEVRHSTSCRKPVCSGARALQNHDIQCGSDINHNSLTYSQSS